MEINTHTQTHTQAINYPWVKDEITMKSPNYLEMNRSKISK